MWQIDARKNREGRVNSPHIYSRKLALKRSGGALEKSAEAGDADAQIQSGQLYFNGKGVAENAKEEVVWFRKSADQIDQQGATISF
jgi:TPR repeat protein